MAAHHPYFRKAAWSLVLQTGSELAAALVGPVVFPLPQTSGAAEMVPIVAAHQTADQHAEPTAARELHSDYLTAVRLCAGIPLCSLLHYRRAYAGLLRDLQATRSYRSLAVLKVKSHTGGTSLPELGDAEADRLCKEFA